MQRIKKDDFFQISEEGGVLPLEMPLKSQKKDQGLTIGIPRESIMDEKRIPLTPQGVKMLTANGFKIMIEQNAGHSSHFS
ncbi:MAG: alanine dehydrogenase, partial [Sphingobacteriales bacterium]|nr:alanine dehydrogenase [Sphingobacteriales bacterium]